MDATPVRPSDESPLACGFALARVSDLYRRVLVVRVSGAHRAGGDAAVDARFVEGHVALGMTLWAPDALILDLSLVRGLPAATARAALAPVEPDLQEGFPVVLVVAAEAREAVAAAVPERALAASADDAANAIARQGPWAIR